MPIDRVLPDRVTPAPVARNLSVDLVRVGALGAVVLGHWLKQGLYVDAAGHLHRAGLLGRAEWTHPLTWAFQVIPLFFVVGGFANALSWRHARAAGASYGAWLRGRVRRLTRPLVPLLVFWAVAAPVAARAVPANGWLHVASDTSLLATWFLAVYVVVVALVPLTLGAWDRWGVGTLAVALAAAAAVDVVSLGRDSYVVGCLNILFVWGTLHQLGYAWLDRSFRRPVVLAGLGAAALAAAVGLVRLGPYGVSMVGVSGFGVNNTYPPRVTVLLLGCAQVAAVLLLEPVLARLARRRSVWQVIVAVEPRVMTIYLWHLTALALLAAGSMWLGGVGLHADPASAQWWALRPVWLVALVVTTLALVVLLGRFETPPVAGRGDLGPLLPLLEVAVVTVSLALMAADGLGAKDGRPRWPVAVVTLAALLLLGWCDRRGQDLGP